MSKEKLNIKITDWDYTCGDGCCYEWGVNCEINGEKIDNIQFASSNEVANGVRSVLEHLGYEVNIEYGEGS